MPLVGKYASQQFRRAGIAALLVAIALMLISAAAVVVGVHSLRSSRTAVDRTSAVLRSMAELQTSLRTAETGQRGFLLTGQDRYLAPYEQARATIPARLAELGRLVEDPDQQQRLRAMTPLIADKLAELAQTVALARTNEPAALRIVLTDRGQRLMDEFQNDADRFVASEQAFLARRVADEERRARLITTLAAAIGLLALLSAAGGLFMFYEQRSSDALARYSRELEQRVEERTMRLSEANRELDAFAYTISHDLRAPLRAMHGYADALVEDYGSLLPGEAHEFTSAIRAAAERMNSLIEDMLSYARMSREELTLSAVSLDDVVDDARRQVLGNASDEQSIPVNHPLGSVIGHRVALEHVVQNLLSNAAKFVRPGEKPQVLVRAEHRRGHVRLWVEDKGIGIAPEHQRRVFEPFERLHGAESYAGTGIGLAIVRRAVERMNGTSGVESSLGEGSRFWIELPAAPARVVS